MNENLIAGYLAYTTADEYVASAAGDAPATPPITVTITVATGSAATGVSVSETVQHSC